MGWLGGEGLDFGVCSSQGPGATSYIWPIQIEQSSGFKSPPLVDSGIGVRHISQILGRIPSLKKISW
jgi:hypothetical protein